MNDQMLMQLLEKVKALQKQLNNLDRMDRLETGTGWIDYSTDSNIIGWSSYTQKEIFYRAIGSFIFCEFTIIGTSNSTAASFTLPINMSSTPTNVCYPIAALDNSAIISTAVVFGSASGNTFTFYTDVNTTGWIAANTKAVRGQFWFQKA